MIGLLPTAAPPMRMTLRIWSRPHDTGDEGPLRAERIGQPKPDWPEHGEVGIDDAQQGESGKLDGIRCSEREYNGGCESYLEQDPDDGEVVHRDYHEPDQAARNGLHRAAREPTPSKLRRRAKRASRRSRSRLETPGNQRAWALHREARR